MSNEILQKIDTSCYIATRFKKYTEIIFKNNETKLINKNDCERLYYYTDSELFYTIRENNSSMLYYSNNTGVNKLVIEHADATINRNRPCR